jgi:hypothetical protein
MIIIPGVMNLYVIYHAKASDLYLPPILFH